MTVIVPVLGETEPFAAAEYPTFVLPVPDGGEITVNQFALLDTVQLAAGGLKEAAKEPSPPLVPMYAMDGDKVTAGGVADMA